MFRFNARETGRKNRPSVFEDQAKYNAIMQALGNIIYREMRMKP